jgi:hypothetical protein
MKTSKLFVVFLFVSLIMSESFSTEIREHPHYEEFFGQNVTGIIAITAGTTTNQNAFTFLELR